MVSTGPWKFMRLLNRWFTRNYRRGFGPQKLVLLLTTTGRITGQPHTTPLQYEIDRSTLYLASARGAQADWYRNALANPGVQVQIGRHVFQAAARPITDPARIADFLVLRLERHPVMVRLIMHLFENLPWRFSFADLQALAAKKALLAIPYEKPDGTRPPG